MLKSEKRILTTHAGSLPRNQKLTDLLLRQGRGEAIDEKLLDRESEAAVAHVVERQLAAGIDIGNDGEQPRVGFQTYVPQRMKGFGGESKRQTPWDMREFPQYVEVIRRRGVPEGTKFFNAPQAIGPLSYDDLSGVRRECAMFDKSAAARFPERFMTAAAPGIIATTMLNGGYFDTHERYVMAVADEIRKEYEYIHSRGYILQLDAPDLAMERTFLFQDKSVDEFVKIVELHIAAVNRAIANIPRDRVRLHVCWATTTARTCTTSQSRPSCPPSTRPASARYRWKAPTRRISTSTRCWANYVRPTGCSSFPGSSIRPPASSSIRRSWPTESAE